MVKDQLQDLLDRSIRAGAQAHLALTGPCATAVAQAAKVVTACFESGGKALLLGNGGSAADAQHLAAEFLGRFRLDRKPLPAIALTADSAIVTSLANDFGFEEIFARQLQALAKPGDVAIAFSTSGQSANVVAGVKAAKSLSLSTIAFTGGDGGALSEMVDIPVIVPSRRTDHIQQCHGVLAHLLCEAVEAMMLGGLDGESSIGKRTVEGVLPRLPKLVNWDELLELRKEWRATQQTVVWTNGCFDLLHVGHTRSLQAAKEFGDVLVVGVNDDQSVSLLKGSARPVVPAEQRAEVVSSLECVDYVVIFCEATPEESLRRLQPEIHCKGADYAPPGGKPIPEMATVATYGGRIEFIPLVPAVSTSLLLKRMQRAERKKERD